MPSPITVAVGSTNPTKVGAAQTQLQALFQNVQITGIEVPSGVSEQPMSKQETKQGAIQRAFAAKRSLRADWGIGMEGGVHVDSDGIGWMGGVTAIVDERDQVTTAEQYALQLPSAITTQLLAGRELGPLMDELTNTVDTKKKSGAIGFLTKGLVKREQGWEFLVACALAPIMNRELYEKKDILL